MLHFFILNLMISVTNSQVSTHKKKLIIIAKTFKFSTPTLSYAFYIRDTNLLGRKKCPHKNIESLKWP